MDVLPKEIDFLYNFKNEIIYLLVGNKITGIDLKMYKFFKFNVEEILARIQERTKKYLNDSDGSTYLSYYKILPNFSRLKRYLIVILSN
jgi:hypothetical protein